MQYVVCASNECLTVVMAENYNDKCDQNDEAGDIPFIIQENT